MSELPEELQDAIRNIASQDKIEIIRIILTIHNNKITQFQDTIDELKKRVELLEKESLNKLSLHKKIGESIK